uniref:Putative tail fiber protein gp53-like C-terminal domain-containing protein n=1 Tax=viral metagenome TaxID=1070528 RepID=A0A6C0JRM1_9ZZZZ
MSWTPVINLVPPIKGGTNNTGTVTFPLAYPNSNYTIALTPNGATTFVAYVTEQTASGFTFVGDETISYFWMTYHMS